MGMIYIFALLGATGILASFLSLTAVRGRITLPERREGWREKLEKKLYQAGWEGGLDSFFQRVFLYFFSFAVVCFALTRSLSIAIMGGIIGGAYFWLGIEEKREKKKVEFQDSIPALIDLIRSAIGAGASVPEAILRVVSLVPEPVKREVEQIATGLRMGKSFDAVVDEVAAKRDDPDFHFLLLCLKVFNEQGGYVLSAMDTLHNVMMDRVNMRGIVRAEQAGLMAVARVLAMAPFASIILGYIVMRPVFAPFYNSPWGIPYLVVVVGGLSIMGWMWIQRVAMGAFKSLEMKFESYSPEKIAREVKR
ncbi:MAG: type II secretion system F family protein [Candidatus Hadarchaeales archaeon]